jgi:hypothetical protein
MKLERFYSDWNGLMSSEAYFDEPTIDEMNYVIKNGKIKYDNKIIVGNENIIEVKSYTGDYISRNLYRDMYKIIN